ncbi:hypothetical protein ASD8599_00001 [Ascidiaceihabitans donghaensis]|uniref:Uncharacterized protein n=1 Tax=Ascidiaceihabitans donghaensis TaxID=1510460 RepID=A0A2R8B8A5_9RHOB|nr:hypothetical protein ASD8599_00001 [Ascidiaceihabitans donghaensis]
MAPSLRSGITVCTDPLPKLLVPTTIARRWSCNAPATISEADAEPPLIKTTIGLPSARSPKVALNRSPSSATRPRVDTISPSSRKESDTRIACVSKPPGLLRKSITKPFTLSMPPSASTSLANFSSNCGVVLSLNVVTRKTTVSPWVRARTGCNSMVSRIMDTSKGSVSPSRTTVMMISEPFGPRILPTASSSVSPKRDSPSTCVMKSPASMPASSAGVPSIGETTFTKPSSCVTSMPRPPNSPRVCTRMAAASLGDK